MDGMKDKVNQGQTLAILIKIFIMFLDLFSLITITVTGIEVLSL